MSATSIKCDVLLCQLTASGLPSCSATSRASNENHAQYARDLKQLCKTQEREIRRLKRQVSTYEILAKTKGQESDSLSALEETITLGATSETLPVNKDTIKALWERDQDACLRVQDLESQVALLSQHVQVNPSSMPVEVNLVKLRED